MRSLLLVSLFCQLTGAWITINQTQIFGHRKVEIEYFIRCNPKPYRDYPWCWQVDLFEHEPFKSPTFWFANHPKCSDAVPLEYIRMIHSAITHKNPIWPNKLQHHITHNCNDHREIRCMRIEHKLKTTTRLQTIPVDVNLYNKGFPGRCPMTLW